MRLRVHHRTEYWYPSEVKDSVNELRVQPPDTKWQTCQSSFITVLPTARLQHYYDFYQNVVHWFEIPERHSRLLVESRMVVETRSKVDFEALPYGSDHARLRSCRGQEDYHDYLQGSHYVEITPEIWRTTLDVRGESEDVFETGYAIMEHIYRNYRYESGATTVSTHANEVIASKAGVCQDFAHVMLAMCRSVEIPARYVSGYFFDTTKGHHMRGADASHAWVEIYLPSQGWFGLDPTNNQVVDDRYFKVATGRDYRDAAPMEGTFYGSPAHRLDVSVTVDRIDG